MTTHHSIGGAGYVLPGAQIYRSAFDEVPTPVYMPALKIAYQRAYEFSAGAELVDGGADGLNAINNGVVFSGGVATFEEGDYLNLGNLGSTGSAMQTERRTWRFRFRSTATTTQRLVQIENDGLTTTMVVLLNISFDGSNFVANTNGRVLVGMRSESNSNAWWSVSSDLGFNDAVWHDLEATFAFGETPTIRVVLDGERLSPSYLSNIASGTYADFDYDVLIGARHDSGVITPAFAGDLDFVRLWEPVNRDIGTITKVASNSGYFRGFPQAGVVRSGADSGRIWLTYRRGASHNSYDGEIVGIYSDDGGASWSSELVIATGADKDYREGGVSEMSDGSIILSVGWRADDGSWAGDCELYQITEGTTWTTLATGIGVSGLTRTKHATQIIELDDGQWMMFCDAKDTALGANAASGIFGDSFVLFSSDNGSTWGNAVQITDGTTDSEWYHECGGCEDPSDSNFVLSLVRGEYSKTVTVHRASKYDLKRHASSAWSPTGDVLSAWSSPKCYMYNGELLVALRDTATEDAQIYQYLDGWRQLSLLNNSVNAEFYTTMIYSQFVRRSSDNQILLYLGINDGEIFQVEVG